MVRIAISQSRDRFQVFVAIVLVALYQTGLAEYAYLNARTIPISSSYWLYMIYAMVAVYVGFHTDLLARAVKNPVFWWALAYLVISLLWTMDTSESVDVLNALLWRLHTVAFLIMGVIVFQSRRATYVARWGIVLATLVAVALNIWDAAHPLWFTAVLGRSAGLYVNPNRSAVALICGMVIGIGVLPEKWRGPFFLATGLGIFLTFSRSATLAIPLVGIGLILIGEIKGRQIVATVCGGLAVVGMYLWITGQSPDFVMRSKIWNDNTIARARMDTNDVSTRERLRVARGALRMFAESPVIGHGSAASLLWEYEVSSHNIYLNLMVDHGIFGAALMPILCYLLYRRNRSALVLVFTIAYLGLYSHNLLEERFTLLPIVLQAVMTQRFLETTEIAATLGAFRRRLALAGAYAGGAAGQVDEVSA